MGYFKLSPVKIVLIIVIVILVILLLKRKPCCGEKKCDCPSVAIPQCFKSDDCPGNETCTLGRCVADQCTNCDFSLGPIYEPTPQNVSYLWDVVVQSTGKTVWLERERIFRYNADGTVDLTFGVAGTLTVPFLGARGIRVGADDSLFVAWSDFTGANGIRKYTPNGTPDLTFGVGGFFQAAMPGAASPGWHPMNYVYEAQDGSVYGLGYEQTFGQMYVFKVSALGALDTSFGISGYANLTGLSGMDELDITRFVVRADGKVIAGGTFEDFSDVITFGSMRLNADGSLDTAYGSGGVCLIPQTAFGANAEVCNDIYAFSSTPTADGTCFVHGYAAATLYSPVCYQFYAFCMVKISPDGVWDQSYGENGVFKFFDSQDGYYENYHPNIILPCDGSHIVSLQKYSGLGDDTYLIRVNSDGTLHEGFDIIKGNHNTDYFWGLAYANGKIYLASDVDGDGIAREYNCAQ